MKDGKITMLVWNINQRAGASDGKSFYPQTVRECLHKGYEIVIFNEIYKCIGWEDLFHDTDYEYKVSDNGKGKNEILIAYNKKLFSMVEKKFTWKSDYDRTFPDYLEVKLKDVENHNIVVVGSRILVNIYDYNNKKSVNDEMKNRAKKGKRIAERLSNLCEKGYIIVGGGDMNTGRRYNKNEYWTKQIFADMLSDKINVIMPDGVSHEAYKGEEYAGCPDLLFFTKNISVDESIYDWTFVKECKEIYNAGEYTKNIPVCYPDHAQIIVSYHLKNKDY